MFILFFFKSEWMECNIKKFIVLLFSFLFLLRRYKDLLKILYFLWDDFYENNFIVGIMEILFVLYCFFLIFMISVLNDKLVLCVNVVWVFIKCFIWFVSLFEDLNLRIMVVLFLLVKFFEFCVCEFVIY